MARAVYMRAEFNALFAYFVHVPQAEYLKTSAVSEDWALPVHEFVQASGLGHQLMARPQVKVVCIGQDDLGVDVHQLVCGHSLDSGLSAHRHKDRGLDLAVGSVENSGPGSGFGAAGHQFKGNCHINQPFLQDQHGIAKAEKPVFPGHSLLIRR